MKAFQSLAVATLFLALSGCSLFTREKRIREPISAGYSIDDPRFRRSMSELLGAPLTEGNQVVELINGKEIFPAMLEAIRAARVSVTLETFIWSSGKVSDRFIEALSERARAGAKVHVIVDALGAARLKRRDIKRMKDAGIEFARFNPVLSRTLLRVNLRTHRKLMVVDGRIGFTGGVCLSDAWDGDAEPKKWRDTFFRVEGPVVGQMQAVFAENWLQTKSEVLHGEAYFPELRRAGSMDAQFVKSGYHDSGELTRLSYLLSIAAARKSIRIAHSYFLPDGLTEDALLEARKRGVDVEIIVPKKSDNPAVGKAARPRWKKLLEAGARFWEYEPTLYHCKVMIVDDVWSIVGSVNFDDRSMRLSDEANLDVLDRAFAAELIETFEDDKKKSRRLTADDMKKRNVLSRLSDHFFGLFRSQL